MDYFKLSVGRRVTHMKLTCADSISSCSFGRILCGIYPDTIHRSPGALCYYDVRLYPSLGPHLIQPPIPWT